jgi:hypothetical protein
MSQPLPAKGDIMALNATQETLALNASDASTLRTSEIRYRRLFESARDGILILDAASLKNHRRESIYDGVVGLLTRRVPGKGALGNRSVQR